MRRRGTWSSSRRRFGSTTVARLPRIAQTMAWHSIGRASMKSRLERSVSCWFLGRSKGVAYRLTAIIVRLGVDDDRRTISTKQEASASVFTTGPIHKPRPEDSDRNPSAIHSHRSDAGPGRSSRTAGVDVGGLDRRVELHCIAALLARPIARALAAAERHVIVDAGRR